MRKKLLLVLLLLPLCLQAKDTTSLDKQIQSQSGRLFRKRDWIIRKITFKCSSHQDPIRLEISHQGGAFGTNISVHESQKTRVSGQKGQYFYDVEAVFKPNRPIWTELKVMEKVALSRPHPEYRTAAGITGSRDGGQLPRKEPGGRICSTRRIHQLQRDHQHPQFFIENSAFYHRFSAKRKIFLQ